MQFDLHAHVIPGVDDGSPDLQVSLEMLRRAEADGTTHLAATPHASSRNLLVQLERRDLALAALEAGRARLGIRVRLIPGMEVRMDDRRIWDLLKARPQALYGAPHERTARTPLLAELPWSMDLALAADLFFQAQLRGYVVVLAHPERYFGFARHLGVLKELLDKGIYLQFNAGSLSGWRNLLRRRSVLRLVRHRPEQVLLGSDTHDLEERPPVLSPARPFLEHALGEDAWDLVTGRNPARMLGLA